MTVANKVAGNMNSWSHSRAVDFEKCKRMAFLKYVKRIPEPPRPLKPGQTEHANDRGSRVHDGLEQFVRGSKNFPHEARHFRTELDAIQRLFQEGRVHLEGEWGYDRDWCVADYRSAWLRVKLDALVFLSETEAIAIDYKTGRKNGNEIKHGEQLMLYQLATFLRFPQLERVHTELYYLDHDELTHRVFTREQGLRFKTNWDKRGTLITTTQDFPPNPNRWSCQYCPYGDPVHGFPNGTGDCQAGRRA